MNIIDFFTSEFNEHANVVQKTKESVFEAFEELLNTCVTCIENGGKIMFFGNGGSAADAQHLATELSCRYKKDRTAIAGLALTTDTSALTAAGNDYGYEFVFSRQIEALGKAGDVVIGISTSGQSANVIKALEVAKQMNITAAGFTGKDGGNMKGLADPLLIVPSNTTARIQEMHITLGQMLCGALELKLGLVS